MSPKDKTISKTSDKSCDRSSMSHATTNAVKHAASGNTKGGKAKKVNKPTREANSRAHRDASGKQSSTSFDIEHKESNEMATTSTSSKLKNPIERDLSLEQETDLDRSEDTCQESDDNESTNLLSESSKHENTLKVRPSTSNGSSESWKKSQVPLPNGWEQHSDKLGLYYWHVATGTIQRNRPETELSPTKDCSVLYHDDEEINQVQKSSSDDDDDYYESGAALTVDDTSESTFVVYPLGCCDFDETNLLSVTSTKAIQKCILKLCNTPTVEDSHCWGLNQDQPIIMKLCDDHIQFIDLKTQNLLRSLPIQTIKTWAVDDDNNFAFVIEDRSAQQSIPETTYYDSLLNEPSLVCYVFHSMDDDNMSCKVAAKLNEEISRFKEQMTDRILKSTRLQQMVEQPIIEDPTDVEDFDELEATNELTMNVKYIGKTAVPRPTGIDILNVAIDKCLAETSKLQINQSLAEDLSNLGECRSPLTEAKLYVSPSSVIVEDVVSGEIIVECRIRFLTFMGISRRDIRWCGFIMQNPTNKTFVAHCFECNPTAGHVCEAIQHSCAKMYEKVINNSKKPPPETTSIIPTRSKIRNTLAKTFSRIKLNPIN